jgi:hypothetical protein
MSDKENFFGDESDVDYDQTPQQLQEVIANAIFKISDNIEDAKENVDTVMNDFYYEVSRKLERKYNVPPWEQTDKVRNN